MIGAAAEIDDRLNRGRNMDTRNARGGMRVCDVTADRHREGADRPWTFRPEALVRLAALLSADFVCRSVPRAADPGMLSVT
jgi:hypothetical protein